MNNILAVDTSHENLHLCLRTAGTDHIFSGAPELNHAAGLLPGIIGLLDRNGLGIADIDLFVCARGPGSFTGLRIGMSTIKGLSAGSGKPCISVNTLDAWAFSLDIISSPLLVIFDGRKNRFYGAFYRDKQRISPYFDQSREFYLDQARDFGHTTLSGPHCKAFLAGLEYKHPFEEYSGQAVNPARMLLEKGLYDFGTNGPDGENSGPFYIRQSDAEISATGVRKK